MAYQFNPFTGNLDKVSNTSDLVTRAEWKQNGFEAEGVYNTDSTMSFVDGTRTFSIQPTATSFNYWVAGVKYTTTGDTVIIGDGDTGDEGIWVMWYNGDTLTATQNPTDGQVGQVIRTGAICAILYWNATDEECIYFGEERHGKVMSPSTHAYLHFIEGLRYMYGLGLNTITPDENGSQASHAQFGIDAGAVSDEDIYAQTAAVGSTVGFPIYYMLGSEASPRWVRYEQAGYCCRTLDGTANDRLAYNQNNSGTWQLTEESNGDFVLYHIFATTEKDNPIISIMGQNGYANRGQARDGAEEEIHELVLNNVLFPEIRPIATVIFQTKLSYADPVNARIVSTDEGDAYIDWRNEVISRTEISTDVHGNLSGLANDDHTQYPLQAGRSGGQTIIGGTDASDELSLFSTSNGTKGEIQFGDGTDQMSYNETLRALAIGADVHQNVVAGATLTGTFATHVDHGEYTRAGIGCERAENLVAGYGAITYGGRSRGNLAARTIVQDGDTLWTLIAVGRDGTDFATAGSMAFEVDGTPGSDDMPGRIVFRTTPDGSQTPAEAMRIESDGNVDINSTVVADRLVGTTKFGGADNYFSVSTIAPGTALEMPLVSFVGKGAWAQTAGALKDVMFIAGVDADPRLYFGNSDFTKFCSFNMNRTTGAFTYTPYSTSAATWGGDITFSAGVDVTSTLNLPDDTTDTTEGNLRYNTTSNEPEYYDGSSWETMGGGGGASAFTGLSDTPANYTGKAGYQTVVNTGETALEFVTSVQAFDGGAYGDTYVDTVDFDGGSY